MGNAAPFLIFFIGAGLALITRGPLRSAIMLAVPLIGALNLWTMPPTMSWPVVLPDVTMELIRIDKLSLLFGYLFHLATLIGVIFSLHLKDTRQHVAALLYAGSALGAVFAGDLLTMFVFWELLALTSVVLILARDTARARTAAMRYLIIQVLSGVILLAGIIAHAASGGSLEVGAIGLKSITSGLPGIASWLLFIAIGIKCCFPMFHTWLSDAYPEATPTGTVFLSAFTTKVAIYALARTFAGTELLVYIGATMAMFPIFFAVIENDLRRVLAYSLINQVGFMVCGIGIGTALAINGAIAHAFNDVVFKGLLFMSMGAVLYRTGKINGSELGGLYKTMPWTTGFCIVGAASISAFPLFSGFVSKSMVMVAALEEHHPWVWLALLFASAGVFHHAGIKIPYFAFFAHDSGLRPREAPFNMLLAMAIASAVCIFNGSYPWLLYSMLPYPVDYVPYTAAHIMTQTQLLLFSALAFVWLQLKGLYPPELASTNLDTDWIYRRLGYNVGATLLLIAGDAVRFVSDQGSRAFHAVERRLHHHHNPDGLLGRTLPTGSMAFWATLMLGGYLLIFYLR